MKVLFLAYDTVNKGPRDKITYNFIEKEMRGLSEEAVEVYFLSRNLTKGFTEDRIQYHALADHLPKRRHRRWLAIANTIFENILFFVKVAPLNPRKAWSLATIETGTTHLARSAGIDILHSHFLWPAGTASSLTAKKLGIPLVSTLRGAELANMPDIDYGSMRDPFFQKAFRLCLFDVSHFTAPSQFLADALTDDYDIPSEKVSYLPNGVEAIHTSKTAGPRQNGTLRLIAIGRLIPRKNYKLIINAINEIANPKVHLLLVGAGEDYNALASMIREYQLEDQVKLQEEMPKEQLYQEVLRSDCLVHPALWEGMPNVMLECLAMGLPCLASKIPVHTELIIEEQNGWLFDATNQQQLAQLITNIANNRPRLDTMIDDCIQSVASLCLDRKIHAYKEIYHELAIAKVRPSV